MKSSHQVILERKWEMVHAYNLDVTMVGVLQRIGIDAWKSSRLEQIRWRKPPPEWLEVNIDGSMSEDHGTSRDRGLIRDEQGAWKGGFEITLRCSSIEEAEAWALLFGLWLAWYLGFGKIIVEVDSLPVFNWVKGLKEIDNSLSNVIQECKTWLHKNWMKNLTRV